MSSENISRLQVLQNCILDGMNVKRYGAPQITSGTRSKFPCPFQTFTEVRPFGQVGGVSVQLECVGTDPYVMTRNVAAAAVRRHDVF